MGRMLVKIGRVISPSGVVASDVLFDGETVVAVGAPGLFESAEQ